MLVAKGLTSTEEITRSLDIAEQAELGDYQIEEMDGAQKDAIACPIRVLRPAAKSAAENEIVPFSELAKLVGQTKGRYNDES